VSTAKFGTFEDLLEITETSQRAIAARLREIILSIHPDACEVVRLGDRAATYGLGPKKMSEGYVYILPYTSWVNLGFYKGADLPDPNGLLDGTGKKLRHVKIRSMKDVENPIIHRLIEAALAERKQALGV
jgi:hypothetical protein